MDLSQLRVETLAMLKAHSLPGWQELTIATGLSYQFVIKEFGVIVCILNATDLTFVSSKVLSVFKGWAILYITTEDDLIEKQDAFLFELMRAGYLKWIRLTYPREFTKVITTTNLATKIIRKRLAIWDGRPKYTFLIADNEDALKHPTPFVLSLDPGFFDTMPEMI